MFNNKIFSPLDSNKVFSNSKLQEYSKFNSLMNVIPKSNNINEINFKKNNNSFISNNNLIHSKLLNLKNVKGKKWKIELKPNIEKSNMETYKFKVKENNNNIQGNLNNLYPLGISSTTPNKILFPLMNNKLKKFKSFNDGNNDIKLKNNSVNSLFYSMKNLSQTRSKISNIKNISFINNSNKDILINKSEIKNEKFSFIDNKKSHFYPRKILNKSVNNLNFTQSRNFGDSFKFLEKNKLKKIVIFATEKKKNILPSLVNSTQFFFISAPGEKNKNGVYIEKENQDNYIIFSTNDSNNNSISNNNIYSTLYNKNCENNYINNIKSYCNINNKKTLYKANSNQISYSNKSLLIFGVFDGHGPNGALASSEVKQKLIEKFNEINKKLNNKYTMKLYNNNDNFIYQSDESILDYFIRKNFINIRDIIKCTEEEIIKKYGEKKFEYSGCTANLNIIISNKYLINVNIGDSRTILVDNKNEYIQISNDHKPNVPSEKERIINNNGKVERIKGDNIGPYRIWFKSGEFPGLSTSRSILDILSKKIGVTSEPEISIYCLENLVKNNIRNKFNDYQIYFKQIDNPICLICASDGFWEFISNERAKNIVLECISSCSKNAEKCVETLVEKAKKMWKMNGIPRDDISVGVMFF